MARKDSAAATRLVLAGVAGFLLAACASRPPADLVEDVPMPPTSAASTSPFPPGRPTPDKGIARMLASDNVGLAQATADSLAVSRDPIEREIGKYWKAVCYLYRDRPDSAVAILEPMQGKWTGGLRVIHSEAFLRLAREASEARVSSRVRRDETARLNQENDVLSKEFGTLKAEIARLETEKKKYEMLIKDLETIR